VTGADRAIRWSTIAAVTGVAIIAAVISYQHATAVVRAHGESGAVARIYAGTIDGLIYAASMALFDAARRGLPSHPLARWLLGARIAATLAANVAAGLAFGLVGAVVAAWPAGALVGSYELLMVNIRQAVGPAVAQRGPAVPAGGPEAARAAWLASVAEGSPLSQRALHREFGVSRRQAGRLMAQSPNGQVHVSQS
jgi:Protein of unknown function (DUF2637)